MLTLKDLQTDGSFGKFYGHPNGQDDSKGMVVRLLDEFGQSFAGIQALLTAAQIPVGLRTVPGVQTPIGTQFVDANWLSRPNYPESGYQADFGLEQQSRWLLVEIELSDHRRSVNSSFMRRAFLTAHLRLGIYILPEHTRLENKRFYHHVTERYNFHSPDYPLWVIGFDF